MGRSEVDELSPRGRFSLITLNCLGVLLLFNAVYIIREISKPQFLFKLSWQVTYQANSRLLKNEKAVQPCLRDQGFIRSKNISAEAFHGTPVRQKIGPN